MANKNWNYVAKVGNPTKAGLYWVTVIWNEWKNSKPTGRRLATVTTRYFADLDKEPNLASWAMYDQPKTGLAWTEECGSGDCESVFAWIPIEEVEIADLPEGVVIEDKCDDSAVCDKNESFEVIDMAKELEEDNRWLYLVGKTGDKVSIRQLDTFATAGYNMMGILNGTTVDRFEVRLATKEDLEEFEDEEG